MTLEDALNIFEQLLNAALKAGLFHKHTDAAQAITALHTVSGSVPAKDTATPAGQPIVGSQPETSLRVAE
jgi:hypothetical protein